MTSHYVHSLRSHRCLERVASEHCATASRNEPGHSIFEALWRSERGAKVVVQIGPPDCVRSLTRYGPHRTLAYLAPLYAVRGRGGLIALSSPVRIISAKTRARRWFSIAHCELNISSAAVSQK